MLTSSRAFGGHSPRVSGTRWLAVVGVPIQQINRGIRWRFSILLFSHVRRAFSVPVRWSDEEAGTVAKTTSVRGCRPWRLQTRRAVLLSCLWLSAYPSQSKGLADPSHVSLRWIAFVSTGSSHTLPSTVPSCAGAYGGIVCPASFLTFGIANPSGPQRFHTNMDYDDLTFWKVKGRRRTKNTNFRILGSNTG